MSRDGSTTMPPGPPDVVARADETLTPAIDPLGWQIFGRDAAPKRAPVTRMMAGACVVEQTVERVSGRRLGTPEGPSIFAITYIVDGLEWGFGNNGRCLVQPGDVLTWHTSHSLGFDVLEPVKKVSLLFDAATIAALLPHAPSLCDMHVPKNSTLGPMLSGFLAALAKDLDAMPAGYHEGAMAMTLEMVSNGIRLDRALTAKGPAEVLLARIAHHVERRLDDPALTAEALAAAHGISHRYLEGLFALRGISPEEFIRERKLVHTRDSLIATDSPPSTTVLAARCGFEDARHFANAFRKRFGVSPDELRRMRSIVGSAE